tara:strand:+ start:91 stop:426 length:336 start_codon:yes stop_codon:yes gene_type:complete
MDIKLRKKHWTEWIVKRLSGNNEVDKETINFGLNNYANEHGVELLNLHGVIHWVALKSNIKPNEDTEECLVKYEDGKVRTALFSQEDFRFYNSMNSQDITEQIKYYCDLPK